MQKTLSIFPLRSVWLCYRRLNRLQSLLSALSVCFLRSCFRLGLLTLKQWQKILLDRFMNRYSSIFFHVLHNILVMILTHALDKHFPMLSSSLYLLRECLLCCDATFMEFALYYGVLLLLAVSLSNLMFHHC